MKKIASLVLVPAVLLVGVAVQGIHHEHGEEGHVLLTPTQLEWQAGPPSLPPGAQYAVLEGDPGQEGMFTMRIRIPAGFRIAPHTHPRVERVTVLEGQVRLGTGREVQEEQMEELEAGSFFVMQPGMEHYAHAGDQETTIQLTSMGPWEINYINPADDPRQTVFGAPPSEGADR